MGKMDCWNLKVGVWQPSSENHPQIWGGKKSNMQPTLYFSHLSGEFPHLAGEGSPRFYLCQLFQNRGFSIFCCSKNLWPFSAGVVGESLFKKASRVHFPKNMCRDPTVIKTPLILIIFRDFNRRLGDSAKSPCVEVKVQAPLVRLCFLTLKPTWGMAFQKRLHIEYLPTP